MKLPIASLAALCSLSFGISAHAGQMIYAESDSKKTVVEPCPPDPLFLFDIRSSYVLESDFERGGGDAKGDALSNSIRFGYRLPVSGPMWGGYDCSQWYLRLGAEYSRFDFDNKGGLPIPNTLQNANAIIALDYLVNGRTAILIETQPGIYFEHDINSGSFDAPVKAVGVIRLSDSVFAVVGARYSALSSYPLLPLVGVHWQIDEQWTLSLVPPDPRLIYSPSKGVSFWVGGEITGGSFKTDNREIERKEKLSGAVVTYSDYRAGAGVTLTGEGWLVELGGGYSFQRKFDFHRAEEGYETDEGAPYATASVRLSF